MKRLYVLSGLIALTCLIGIYCSKKSSDPEPPPASSHAPQIDSLSGPYAWPDEQLTIYGLRFGDTQDSTRNVIIWPDTVDVISWSDTQIETDIPNNLGVTHVTVAADKDTSNAVPFSVFGITSVEPGFALFGDTIRIHGLGFGGSQDTNTVMIGGVPAHVVSWYYTLIVAIIPDGAGSGDVEVNANGHTSTWRFLAINGYPLIMGIEPDWGPWETDVEIQGTWFGDEQGSSLVEFGVTQASVSYWSDSLIRTEVPEGATSGDVTVAVAGRISNSIRFDIFSIHRVVPDMAEVGDTVIIEGEGFGEVQGTSSVTVGSLTASVVFWSDISIHIVIDDSLESSEVVVKVNGVNSNTEYLYVIRTPVITAIIPEWVANEDEITIRGRHLGNEGTAHIGGYGSIPVYFSDTLVIAPVPEKARSGYVFLFFQQGSTNKLPIDIFHIDEVYPFWGVPGDTVTISGTGLRIYDPATSRIVIGGVEADILSWTDSFATAVVPSNPIDTSVYLSTRGKQTNERYFLVREYPEIFVLLASMNYVEVVYKGQMIFTRKTECDSITWIYDNVQWSIDALSDGFQFEDSYYSQPLCKGLISPDGSMIDSLYCYRYKEVYYDLPGPDVEVKGELYAISAEDIELHEINEEDSIITFRADGPVVEQHIAYIEMFERWSLNWGLWVYYWRYVDTDWDNTDCPPSITVTFEKR